MKTKFTTVDIRASVLEVKRRWIGMRVTNVYDIDNKTYLVKLAKPDQKALLVLESGSRFHSTEFDWPKNNSPSGFSMKLRKHLRGRRLESVQQLGADRVVDMQFGSNEAAYHIVLELYDRGNLVLTDHEYNILNLLRVRTDESQDVKLAVHESYPLQTARQDTVDHDKLHSALLEAKEGDHLKRILNPLLPYGPALIEHSLRAAGLPENCRMGKEFIVQEHMASLLAALVEAQRILENMGSESSKGYIIQKKEKKASSTEGDELITYNEFHPYLYKQHESCPHLEFESFSKAVDEFFSKIESQKLDMKTLQQEKSVLRKLENVRKDHAQRLQALANEQEKDNIKGQLIEMNLPLVERAILVVQSALANQLDWADINQLVKEAQAQGDPVASSISSLQLQSNHFTMMLRDCYEGDEEDMLPAQKVQIDLGLSAYANARKYYDKKKHAAQKEQKTVAASTKALKSAEKKTKQTLKEVQVAATIRKQRKTHWFEKFLWFISSENYLVIGGRDQQQNELLVKRHLRPGDLYVHADLHGASSVIIKNPSGVPPKTLNEAGTMALCHSAAWDAKVVTSAWWVHHHQVSKTAPTGEYLTTGSFMIRGKKNFLPPSYLIYGFGFLFKVDDTSIFRHQDERKVRTLEQEEEAAPVEEEEVEEEVGGGEDEDSENESVKEEVVQQVLEEVKEEEEEKEEEDMSFPDTHIELQHIQGGKFGLQSSLAAAAAHDEDEDDVVYLGDDRPLSLKPEDKPESKGGARLSAKQRRQMKKARQQGEQGEDEELKPTPKIEKPPPSAVAEKEETKPQQVAPLKRGQKNKLKKIREKYADQDEEERQLRMEILQGSQERKPKKGRKAKQQQQQLLKENKLQQKQQPPQKPRRTGPLTAADILVETPECPAEVPAKKSTEDDGNSSGEEERQALEADDVRLVPDADVLASLTGLPDAEDVLLCSVPVCAPYSTLSKYKYKVKLIPGSTKRGKVCKVALNMFQTDRSATQRERELLKSLKEEDMARNLPGKCKVSAPNLHKNKGK
ncbi:hypothetical protein CAPTEDRAFT_151175 [Capitella teleta]|uniref:NFACT RNA-binding domain-containing protein n=1 Tax=Capitella teleta TaxID=283909 RepID=R7U968_CAPTE|nr:hypothetical protein CAPTEDRAFT_151175 [Capitella teleta]|eukprot:ELU02895.1 hypothetical protein CAPTEDRAFT_151175 [Capitella teleta]